MSSLASPALRRITAIRDLLGIVWSESTLCLMDMPCLTALSASSLPKITSFAPRQLVATAWSLAVLTFAPGPLREALAAEALRRIRAFELLIYQHL